MFNVTKNKLIAICLWCMVLLVVGCDNSGNIFGAKDSLSDEQEFIARLLLETVVKEVWETKNVDPPSLVPMITEKVPGTNKKFRGRTPLSLVIIPKNAVGPNTPDLIMEKMMERLQVTSLFLPNEGNGKVHFRINKIAIKLNNHAMDKHGNSLLDFFVAPTIVQIGDKIIKLIDE